MNKEVEFYIDNRIIDGFFETKKRYIVAYGGRGSGKSMQFAALCILYAVQNPKSRILAIRGNQNKISESSLQTLKDVISMMGLDNYFIMTENTLSCKNGSSFIFYGAKNYNSFKSLQRISLVFVDEATELSKPAWESLVPTIRADDSRFLISFNPEKKEDWVYDSFVINNHPESVVIKMNYDCNPFFPEVLKVEMLYDKKSNLAKYNHIWLGQLISLTTGALFNQEMFHYLSEEERQDIIQNKYGVFEKIVVALDPSGTSKATSDACGIMVVGKYAGIDRWCIIEDKTKIQSPSEWASNSVALYNKYDANKIIYESNFGGDMVKAVIKAVDKYVPIDEVRATKGKLVRAEPIVALYEQGKVDHFSKFVDLEYELTTYTGDNKQKSPNRLDAMVWGVSYLFNKNGRKMSIPRFTLNI